MRHEASSLEETTVLLSSFSFHEMSRAHPDATANGSTNTLAQEEENNTARSERLAPESCVVDKSDTQECEDTERVSVYPRTVGSSGADPAAFETLPSSSAEKNLLDVFISMRDTVNNDVFKVLLIAWKRIKSSVNFTYGFLKKLWNLPREIAAKSLLFAAVFRMICAHTRTLVIRMGF